MVNKKLQPGEGSHVNVGLPKVQTHNDGCVRYIRSGCFLLLLFIEAAFSGAIG